MGSVLKYRQIWMWENTTPGTTIWLLKDSGNSEVMTKNAEKVFKYFSKLGKTNQPKPTNQQNKKKAIFW